MYFVLPSQNAIDYFSVGTPITNEHYLKAREGAIYGLEHSIERFSPKQASLLRPESGIEGITFSICPHKLSIALLFSTGLYLCGQDVMCSGFVPSMMSGLLATSAILKTNLFNDLVVLHKKTKTASFGQSNKKD